MASSHRLISLVLSTSSLWVDLLTTRTTALLGIITKVQSTQSERLCAPFLFFLSRRTLSTQTTLSLHVNICTRDNMTQISTNDARMTETRGTQGEDKKNLKTFPFLFQMLLKCDRTEKQPSKLPAKFPTAESTVVPLLHGSKHGVWLESSLATWPRHSALRHWQVKYFVAKGVWAVRQRYNDLQRLFNRNGLPYVQGSKCWLLGSAPSSCDLDREQLRLGVTPIALRSAMLRVSIFTSNGCVPSC
jgi:hypothetical protein